MFVKITNGQAQANYTTADLKKDNPNVSFPVNISDKTLAKFNVYGVKEISAPNYNSRTHRLVTQAPELIDGVWTVRRVAVAKDQLQIDNENASMASQVRSKRDSKLANSDWTQVLDAPVDRTAWAAYRQALRDVPAQEGFPWNVTWPEQPE